VQEVAAGAQIDATVAARDDSGPGPAVPAPTWTAASPPAAPSGATAAPVPDAAAVRVSWSAPPTGEAVTGYVVEVRAVEAPDVVAARRTLDADGRAVIVDGLRHGVRYMATVAAVGVAGVGPTRGTDSVVTAAAPVRSDCASCAEPVAQAAAPAPSRAAPASPAPAPTLADAPPVRSASDTGPPVRLLVGIGGIVVAACLAITAVLLRRRSARVG
jgi:hypothetical protein